MLQQAVRAQRWFCVPFGRAHLDFELQRTPVDKYLLSMYSTHVPVGIGRLVSAFPFWMATCTASALEGQLNTVFDVHTTDSAENAKQGKLFRNGVEQIVGRGGVCIYVMYGPSGTTT